MDISFDLMCLSLTQINADILKYINQKSLNNVIKSDLSKKLLLLLPFLKFLLKNWSHNQSFDQIITG